MAHDGKAGRAHLFFVLAKDAPVGAIFRRGPNKWVQTIKWNTNSDTFEPGQWFCGRIYEKRCDLSPDGSKLVYFAQKMTWKARNDREYTTNWTAVSKLPYLTALALWPKGSNSDGGGTFISNTELRLNHCRSQSTPHPAHLPQGLTVLDNGDSDALLGWDEPVLGRRLERDGWSAVQAMAAELAASPYEQELTARIKTGLPCDVDWATSANLDNRRRWLTRAAGIRCKSNGAGSATLTVTTTAAPIQQAWRSSYQELVHTFKVDDAKGASSILARVEWADFDQSGRLVFVRDGRLFAGERTQSGFEEREIADFNANKPEPVAAPEWARKW